MPHTRTLGGAVDFLAIHRAQPDRWPFLLSSTAPGGQLGRYSLLLFQQGDVLSIEGPGAGRLVQADRTFLDALDRLDLKPDPAERSVWPFIGGWFVYLAYELVGSIETRLSLPAAADSLPIAHLARCPAALIHDHDSGEFTLLGETAEALDSADRSLNEILPWTGPAAAIPAIALQADDGEEFRRGVDRIREWIRAGDVFQVNLSRAWQGHADTDIDPCAVYAALAQANPSPFAGLARMPGGTVISSSPERLVEVREGIAQTRPIAGTRPRGADEQSDADLSAELVAHPKERAEHIMLIDLERNDLGRVCEVGSVDVDELMVIESYAHVHHIVSNIRGRLRPDISPADVVRAVFPGGTITGCPKVRCMEIIATLEGRGRSFYTGSMGYIGRDGHLDLNILIRSLSVQGQHIEFRTGAGIVADSDRDAELAETEAKARGLIRALIGP